MALRLEIAERELRSFLSDRLTNRGVKQAEVALLARLRLAMTVIAEVKLGIAAIDAGADITREAKGDHQNEL